MIESMTDLEAITEVVHPVANEIMKHRGYQTTIQKWDVKLVLEAFFIAYTVSQELKENEDIV